MIKHVQVLRKRTSPTFILPIGLQQCSSQWRCSKRLRMVLTQVNRSRHISQNQNQKWVWVCFAVQMHNNNHSTWKYKDSWLRGGLVGSFTGYVHSHLFLGRLWLSSSRSSTYLRIPRPPHVENVLGQDTEPWAAPDGQDGALHVTDVWSAFYMLYVRAVYLPSRHCHLQTQQAASFSKICSKIKPAVRRSAKQQRDTISNLVDKAEQKRQMFPWGAGADRNRPKKASEYWNMHSPGSQKTKCVLLVCGLPGEASFSSRHGDHSLCLVSPVGQKIRNLKG